MHIDSLEIFHVALPYRQPQGGPLGMVDSLRTVLVRIVSGSTAGWGEASPGNAPLAGPEWAAGVFGCLRDWLAPRIVGQTLGSGRDLQEWLEPVRGNRFAKAALDTAWWDLQARLLGQPLPQLLGAERPAIEVGASFDQMDSIDEFMEGIGAALDAGFARVELKFRPGWDIQMLNSVRHLYPTAQFHIDCEGAMRLAQMEILYRVDDFHVAMIEQPLPADDLVGHAMVQESLRTPLCLDEGITTLEQAEMALELRSAKYVNLKPGRVGGLTTAIAIHDACKRENVPCWVGGMPQSEIGARIGYALAAKANCTYPADYFSSGKWLQADVAEPLVPRRDPADGLLRIPLWSEPGLGIEPDVAVLEKFCIDRARI